MSGYREENIRVRVQTISDLPTLADQFQELIKLTRQQQEITQQAALSARTGAIQQVDAINGITDALSKQRKQQKETSSEYEDLLKNTNKQLEEAGKSVRNFATLLGTAFAVSGVKSFALDVIDAKTKIDNLKISLDVMLGSKTESAKLYKDIVTLAKETPFTLEEVADNVVKLKAYNIATADLIPTVNALGNIAAAVGKDKLPQLTLAYGQVINMGKLMGTETRQFIEAGVPLYDLLADSMKKPKAEVIALASEHRIMAADVKKAIMESSEAGGKYYGIMALQSKTVGGEVDKMKDSYQQAKVLIGDFFEKTIQSGTRQLNSLMESTIGSNTAIARTFDIVKSVAAAMATYTVATKAQATVDAIVSTYQAAKNILYGEYLLTMRAVTAQQIVFTAAETEAVVAAEAFNLAIASNPVGAFITLIGVLTTAFFAYKAVTDDVTSAMGEQELKIRDEQAGMNTLVKAALNATDSNKLRKESIELLIQKYPEYFKGLDTERTTNSQLLQILNQVNKTYEARISLAREAYKADELSKQRMELFQKEADFFDKIGNKQIEIQFGGSVQKFVETLKAGGVAAQELRDKLDDAAMNGADKFRLGAIKINNEFIKIEKSTTESNNRAKAANDSSRDAEVAAIVKHYDILEQQANGNSKKIAQLNAEEKIALGKANGTYREQEVKAVVDNSEKLKSVTLLSAKEIAVIKKEGDAEQEVDRGKQLKAQLDFLNKQEAQEIDSVNKIKVNKKISSDALAALQEQARIKIMAIDAEYDKKRAVIQEQMEAETQKNFLIKAQESNDKIAVLTAKRLEAEAMLTRLNDAKTNDERLSALREYNTKFTENIQEASLKQLKIQLDVSREVLDDIILTNGRKGDEYRKAYDAWLKDNVAYNSALTTATVTSAKETAKQIKEYEKEIQDSKKETAKIEKQTAEENNKTRAEVLSSLAGFISQQGGLLGELATGVTSIYNSIDGLQLKTLSAAKTALTSAQDSLAGIKMIYADGSAEGDAAIAKGTEALAKAKGNLAEAEGVSTAAVVSMVQVAAQIVMAINQAQAEAAAATYFAIAEGLQKARDAYTAYYAYVIKTAQESHTMEMEYFKGNLAEKTARIDEYYAHEAELVEGKDRTNYELLYWQKSAEMRANAFIDAKAMIQAGKDLQEAQWQYEIDKATSKAEVEKAHAKETYDTQVEFLEKGLASYTAAKDAEIAKLNETLAIEKAAQAQYSSDDQLRLQEDDTYRTGLLQQGEAREVAFLEAAKQRELVRAHERSASAEEVAQIITAFDLLIKNKHEEYEDAKGNKSKAISLATQEIKAQETDKVGNLEKAAAGATTAIQNQIRTQEVQVSMEKTKAYLTYANAVKKAEAEIFEAQKAVIVAQLQAQIAILNAQKSWTGIGNGKINDAINQINESINRITGTGVGQNQTSTDVGGIFNNIIGGSVAENLAAYKFASKASDGSPVIIAFDKDLNPAEVKYNPGAGVKTVYDGNGAPFEIIYGDVYIPATGARYFDGTDYLERGKNPVGRDTVPIMAHEGERIIKTADNLALGGKSLSNERLVEKVLGYDRFIADYPKFMEMAMVMPTHSMSMKLPENVMNSQGGNMIDLSGLESEMKLMRRDMKNLKQVSINMDESGFSKSITRSQSTVNYISNLMQQ